MIRTDIRPEKVVRMYVDQGLSVREIARYFNTNTTTIASRLELAGVTQRDYFRPDLDSRMIKDLYLSGKSAMEIGRMNNVSYGTIVRRLRKENVTIRPNTGKNCPLYRGGPRKHKLASTAVERAIRDGSLKRPNICSECGKTPPKFSDGRSGIDAHHNNYNNDYLDVVWLCRACHKFWHRHNNAIPFSGDR